MQRWFAGLREYVDVSLANEPGITCFVETIQLLPCGIVTPGFGSG
jgi:hypothetical protein